jgi:hypothetical protein
MKTKQKSVVMITLIMSLTFSACGPGQLFGPTLTPTYTSTHTPTPTPTSTLTPTLPPILFCSGDPLFTPKLISPTNGSKLNTLIPNINIQGNINANANFIHLNIARNSEFDPSSIVWQCDALNQQEIFGCQVLYNLEEKTKYYWRINYRCNESNGKESEIWSFTTGSGGIILPAPELLSPIDMSGNSINGLQLDWGTVTGATNYIIHIHDINRDQWMIFESATHNLLVNSIGWWAYNPGPNYEWYVEAQNDYATGIKSQTWAFTKQ